MQRTCQRVARIRGGRYPGPGNQTLDRGLKNLVATIATQLGRRSGSRRCFRKIRFQIAMLPGNDELVRREQQNETKRGMIASCDHFRREPYLP